MVLVSNLLHYYYYTTAIKYNERLKKFETFIAKHYSLESIEQIISRIKKGKMDVYDLLGIKLASGCKMFMVKNDQIHPEKLTATNITSESILISILYLIGLIPWPESRKKKRRGRPYVYSPTVILRCFVVRIWLRLDS
ncbi:MAG TPA: hypothetical protein VFJ51_12955, partial [Nitrososphaeraceae archaeon]|nr:hypothetical protein [Nitrososphaeraceae archaeon]